MASSTEYRVYLDKFASLPHLPLAAECTDKNPRRSCVTPKMSHTGIRTMFEPPIKKPVYSSGNLTNEYISKAHFKGRQTARAIMKAELALVRSKFEKSTYIEDQLLLLEEKRHAHQQICDQQLDEESAFMRDSPSENKSVRKSKKGKKKSDGLPASSRPHKVYSEESLVRCILDTTDMTICSSNSGHVDDTGSLSTTSTMRRRKVNTAKWDAEALALAHGSAQDDELSLSSL